MDKLPILTVKRPRFNRFKKRNWGTSDIMLDNSLIVIVWPYQQWQHTWSQCLFPSFVLTRAWQHMKNWFARIPSLLNIVCLYVGSLISSFFPSSRFHWTWPLTTFRTAWTANPYKNTLFHFHRAVRFLIVLFKVLLCCTVCPSCDIDVVFPRISPRLHLWPCYFFFQQNASRTVNHSFGYCIVHELFYFCMRN